MISEQSIILRKNEDRTGKLRSFWQFLCALPLGESIELIARPYKSTRSNEQNAWLNGCIYKTLMDATGYERDDISKYCCGLYFGEKEKRVPRSKNFPKGIELVPCRTTTVNEAGKRDVLTWDAFSDYVAFLQRYFAQECGIYLPDPDPNWKQHQQQEAA